MRAGAPKVEDRPEATNQEERERYLAGSKRQKDTARLIWASKPRKEPSPKDLEFQTAEEVYPNVANGTLKSFLGTGRKDISEQPNRLIWGDNLLVMQALLAQGYEGQIDLIYIDPPFNTGENFNFPNEVTIGDKTFEKEMPMNERLTYTDTWDRGIDSFLDMLYPRLQLMRRLLSEKGSIYVHCDWRMSGFLRLILDEVFGSSGYRNTIIWQKIRVVKAQSNSFGNVHDYIYLYSKSKNLFNQATREQDPEYEKKFDKTDPKTGRKYQLVSLVQKGKGPARTFGDRILEPTSGMHWIWSQERIDQALKDGLIEYTSSGNPRKKQYLDESGGRYVDDLWFDIFPVNSQALESCNYPTQKPEALLERIILASSNEGDLIADLFCGSGTTAAVAERLGRRWITSDLSKTAIQVARARFVNQNAAPFVIQNLGNYQRQLVYLKEVRLREMYDIVLKLYGAVPREDLQGFGTKKEDKNNLVFVSEPDRPVTAKKALDLAKRALQLDGRGYRKLTILAWDYDLGFDEEFRKIKASQKHMAEVEFKVIPSDVYKYLKSTRAGEESLDGKITFYQKPYLRVREPEITKMDGDTVHAQMRMEQYVVLDIPVKDETKRPEIEALLKKNFSYLIDYWAADWDYDGQVFRSRWQAIRDKKKGEPVPVVADTTLKRGKKYTIAVRVVDVFGNDASVTKELDLR